MSARMEVLDKLRIYEASYTVRSFMTELMLFKSSPNRRTAERSISISVSVHLALRDGKKKHTQKKSSV